MYNCVQNIPMNISTLGPPTHLKLGEPSSLYITYNITVSWPHPLHGFWFYFLLPDKEAAHSVQGYSKAIFWWTSSLSRSRNTPYCFVLLKLVWLWCYITLSFYQVWVIWSKISKIFEKVMYKRLYAYLECHNILYSLQFGFRQKCSTNHALLSIAESIRSSVDNKEFGCCIFIDLKKAFDTVNHSILLLKLHHYGVRGKAYEWFHSYLSNREQFVSVNGHDSDSLPLTCGVPQGSILGPLLFLLYVNDLPNASSLLTFHLFADDTNIYYSSKNLDDLESKLNNELKVARNSFHFPQTSFTNSFVNTV